VAKDGKLVYAAGFGSADKEDHIDLSVNHKLRIGSVSKSVTAVAVMRLIESGAKFGGKPLTLDSHVFGPDGVLGAKIKVPALIVNRVAWPDVSLFQPLSGPGAGGRSGSTNENVLPRPGSLSTPIDPPCASTRPLEIARPRPWLSRFTRFACQ